jgi:hypothetical protein
MVSPNQSPTWDFTPVINFVHSLYNEEVRPPDDSLSGEQSTHPPDLAKRPEARLDGLGNFENVLKFLELRPGAAPPESPGHSDKENGFNDLSTPEQLEDATTTSKGVRWRDEFDGADLEDNAEWQPYSSPKGKKSKKQRANERRKSSVDYYIDGQGKRRYNWMQHVIPKPDRKSRKKNSKQQGPNGHATTSDVTTDAESEDELQGFRKSADRRAVIQQMIYGSSPPKATTTTNSKKQRQVFEPFQYQIPFRAGVSTQPQIQPRVPMTESDRRIKLIVQLAQDFPRDQHFLLAAGTTDPRFNPQNTSPTGIHTFIDISNILIGFHDALKESHDIPIAARIRRVPLSFYNLSLILERGRPVAKRVLAGSDQFPSITDAKSLGYETNILSRVQKSKELTAKQKKYVSASSGSETATNASKSLFTPEKWVEQGVDEILHLKMLESIIDYAETPSTIVLATGDAAEAEYSGGFLKMVERALERGWTIELVSFKRNTSGAYKNKAFREKWNNQFQTIGLDKYAEELFGYGK